MSNKFLKDGRYQVVRRLGSGYLGEVYLVKNTLTKKHEALKILYVHAQQNGAGSFQDKAKTISALHHPHILPLLDYGEESIDGSSLPYIIMPYCPDNSLAAWLQQPHNMDTLSLQDVACMLRQVVDALQHAHEQGIVHQGVKPSNVLMSGERTFTLPNLLLADFVMTPPETLHESRATASTYAYMAPEQWRGAPRPATDQYALAALLYQILTGNPPFHCTPWELMHQHTSSLPVPPGTINPVLSQGINSVLLRALAKHPDDRFLTISAFSDAFEQAIQL
ncbi:MAG TPA: serine/threonine-protein kinase, partial [Ktedonobacteraceae bacterium]|nr:serine/threonine-protein kinase [Ktedonobacteraceae bacterium]